MSKNRNEKLPVRPVRQVVKPATPIGQTISGNENASKISKNTWLFGLFVALFGFVLYANTFSHQYALDDYSVIKDNYIVQGGLKNVGTIFTTEYRYGYKAWNSVGSLYRPATLTMLAAEWQIAPDKPFFYHFINVLFFALTGLLIWLTWRRILKNYPPVLPAIAALIFMAHPAHVESVANIKSLDEIMSLFFCTAALWGIWEYLEKNKTIWLAAAMFFYGVAFFFKESAITFLAVFPLVIWFFSEKNISQNLKVSGLMVIPAAFFLLVRHQVLGKQPHDEKISILDNFVVGADSKMGELASAFRMCFQYLKTLVFPHPLVSDMGFPQMKPVGFGDVFALLGLVLFVGGGIWALMNLKKRHFLAFAILFFLITISLYSNVFVLIGTSYGERLLYVPTLGFGFGVAWLLCKIFKINDLSKIMPEKNGTAIWAAAGVLIGLFALKTFTRNPVWYDSAALYRADIKTSPDCAKLNYHLALEFAKDGIDEKAGKVKDAAAVNKAIEHYTKAMTLYKDYNDAYGSRGVAYFRLEQYDKALADYEVALKYNPNDAKVLSNLGYIYFLRKNYVKAEEVYKRAVKSDPRFVDARRNLGTMFALNLRFPEAIEQWKAALEIEPDNPTLLGYIGSAFRDQRKPDEALPWLEKAYKADPKFPSTLIALADVAVMKKDYNRAIPFYKSAVAEQPTNFLALYSIYTCYTILGQPDEAKIWKDKAVAVNPQLVNAPFPPVFQ